jgi:hypothetical protein
MTIDTLTLNRKIDVLPTNLRKEALLFIDFLIEKSGNNQRTQRRFGSAKGKIHMSKDFDEPLADIFEDYM